MGRRPVSVRSSGEWSVCVCVSVSVRMYTCVCQFVCAWARSLSLFGPVVSKVSMCVCIWSRFCPHSAFDAHTHTHTHTHKLRFPIPIPTGNSFYFSSLSHTLHSAPTTRSSQCESAMCMVRECILISCFTLFLFSMLAHSLYFTHSLTHSLTHRLQACTPTGARMPVPC
jgi:hypothetical protein